MKNRILKSSLLVILGIVIGIGGYTIKASGTLQSQGKLVYTNPETGQTEVVIDTNDFSTLQENIDANTSEIHELKTILKDLDGMTVIYGRGECTYSPTCNSTTVDISKYNFSSTPYVAVAVTGFDKANIPTYKPSCTVGAATAKSITFNFYTPNSNSIRASYSWVAIGE